MNEREFIRVLERLFERLERNVVHEIKKLLHPHHHHEAAPAAGTLTGIFTLSGDSNMSQMTLSATPPTTRVDGSALVAAAIASITFQKVPAGGAALLVLQVNKAASPGAGLQPSDLLFADTNAAVGDDYTFFVTDTAGTAGAPSNDVVAAAAPPPPLAAPSAGTLVGTFTQ
jgi:hypothetical protein